MSKATAVGVEQELLTATKSKGQKPKESEADYRARVVRAASDLDKEEWDGLSAEAKSWFNAGVEAIEAETEVAAFPEAPFDSEDNEAEETEEEETEVPRKAAGKAGKAAKKAEPDEADEEAEDEAPKAGKAGKKAGKPASKKEDAEEEEETEEDPPKKAGKPAATPTKKKGGIHYLRRLILKNPSWDKPKLLEKVTSQGYTMSPTTVGVQLYELRAIKELLAELGMLKETK